MRKIYVPLLVGLVFQLLTVNTAYAQSCNDFYVTPNGTGTGTVVSPANIYYAVQHLTTTPTLHQNINMLKGEHVSLHTLDLPSNVTIDGGYKIVNGNWVKGDTNDVTLLHIMPGAETEHLRNFNGDTVAVNSVIGLRIDSVTDIIVKDLTLKTEYGLYQPDDDGNGWTIYDVYTKHAFGTSFINVNFTSGQAGEGASGQAGESGRDGNYMQGGGLQIDYAHTTDAYNPVYKHKDNTNVFRAAGRGGKGGRRQEFVPCNDGYDCITSSCVPETPAPKGGDGGPSGYRPFLAPIVSGGLGGVCGDACNFDCYYNTYRRYTQAVELANIYNGNFVQGSLDADATPGTDGLNGTGVINGFNYSTNPFNATIGDKFEYYIPAKGHNGGDGAGGGGGAGGGAGGIRVFQMPPGVSQVVKTGKNLLERTLTAFGVDVCSVEVLNIPGVGGDGGGGGEGGEGGEGGGGGGGNFGIYAIQNSQIGIVNCRFNLGPGGIPGDGGTGGHGGLGFMAGTAPPPPYANEGWNYPGADGGKGGNGADAGGGQNGHAGEVYTYYGLANISGLSDIAIDAKKFCTNSVIGVYATNPNDYIQLNSANDIRLRDLPQGGISPGPLSQMYVASPALGTFNFQTEDSATLSITSGKSIVITDTRPAPVITAGPATICDGDSLVFTTTDVAGQYRWKIYDTANNVVMTLDSVSGHYKPAIPNINYYLSLQEYQQCCGWSIPVFYAFTVFKSYIKPQLLINGNPGPYCEGSDSTQLLLQGLYDPSVTRIWSNGEHGQYSTYIKEGYAHSLIFQFPNGCYSFRSDSIIISITPPPTDVPQSVDIFDVCDQYPSAFVSPDVPLYPGLNYSFYDRPNTYTALPGGANVFQYTPTFNFINTDLYYYYYALTDPLTGCSTLDKGIITLHAEHNPPVVTSPNSYSFFTDQGRCGTNAYYPQPTAYDQCSNAYVNLISGLGSNSFFSVGQHIEIFNVHDLSGNAANFTLTVDVKDNVPPVISGCPGNVTVNNDAGACGTHYNYPSITAADLCSVQLASQTWVTPYTGLDTSFFLAGTYTVKKSFTDASGNTSICAFNITVVDTSPPVINCPGTITRYLAANACTADVGYNWPQFTDNCKSYQNENMVFVSGFGSSGVRTIGTTTETYQVFDGTNTVQCSFNVTVRDTSLPVFISGITTLNTATDAGHGYATLHYTPPVAIDNCGDTVAVTLIAGTAPDDTTGPGRYTIVWQAMDSSGNTSVWPIELQVFDNEGPTVICPSDIVVAADAGVCGAMVPITIAPALDNDGHTYPVTLGDGLPGGSVFPVGTTLQYYRSTDVDFNTGGCVFNVTVIDTTPPVFSLCPNDTAVYVSGGNCQALVNYGTPIAVDGSCGISFVDMTEGPQFNVFSTGNTRVVYRAQDTKNNNGYCVFNVNVIDTTTYTITCTQQVNITANPDDCGASYRYPEAFIQPRPGSNCFTTTLLSGYGSGNFRPVGTTVDYYQYVIGGGATILSCFTTVTVIDNLPPVISNCGHDTIVSVTDGHCGAEIVVPEPTATDNCHAYKSMVSGITPGPGVEFPVGVTVQHYEFFDGTNTDSCKFNVTVLDTVKPHILPIPTVYAHTGSVCGTVVNFTPPVGTDNTTCITTTLVGGLAPGQVFPMGTTVEKYMVRDAYGNIGTCSFNVVVTPDLPVTVDCSSPPSTHADDGQGAIVYYQTPGCRNATTVKVSGLGSGAYYRVGLNHDDYLIIDQAGDTATCSVTVHVFETNPPTISCSPSMSIEVDPDSLVNCMTYVQVTPAIPNDGTGISLFYNTYTHSASASTNYPVGNTQLLWNAFDLDGFNAFCVQNITITEKVSRTPIVTLPSALTLCSGEDFVYDPVPTPANDSATFYWQIGFPYAIHTISNSSALVLHNLSSANTASYSLYMTSPCTRTPRMLAAFNLTVNPSAQVHIAGLATQYCIDDTAGKIIIGSPVGGRYSGAGVVGGMFYPALADTGLHVIYYARDTSGVHPGGDGHPATPWACTDTATLYVRVNSKPEQPAFITQQFCINGVAITLDTANSTYSGVGVTGSTFTPALAGGGTDAITRTISKGGCTVSYSNNINVSTDVPDATILSRGPYCNNASPTLLLAADTTGVWAGPLVTTDTFGRAVFSPKLAAVPGYFPLRYDVTKGICTASDSVNILVKESHYNTPYDLPEYCLNGPPIDLDTSLGRQYLGDAIAGDILNTTQYEHGGIKFYMIIGTNAIGCSDTAFRMLWIHGPDVPFEREQAACAGDSLFVDLQMGFNSLLWQDGNTSTQRWLTQPGYTTVMLQDTFGCSGRDTVFFSYHPLPDTTITRTGDTLTANAIASSYQWYKDSVILPADTFRSYRVVSPGSYFAMLTDSFHCSTPSDTFVIRNICSPVFTSQSQVICAGQTLAVGIHVYTHSGFYSDTLRRSNGCDSIVVTGLTVSNPVTTSQSFTICTGQSILVGAHSYSVNGTYTDSLISVHGCDSVITTQITVTPNITTSITLTICQGGSFEGYTSTGTYLDHFTSSVGCDSARTLNLTVTPNVTSTVNQTICQGSSFEGYTSTGTYLDHFTSVGGCDSARTLNLTVTPNVTSTVNQTICQGSSFEGYTSTGTYIDHFTSSGGCDSARTLNLTVTPNVTSTVNQTICQGSSFEGYISTGTYLDHFTSSGGCDSARTLNLTVTYNITSTVNQAICQGSSFEGYTSTGTYLDHFTSVGGCDSARTLNLTVTPNVTSTVNQTICQGSSFEGYISTGTYLDHFTSSGGCDSARTLNLTVTNNITSTVNQTICQGSSFEGYTSTGTYLDHFTRSGGCDSARTLNLTVTPNVTSMVNQTICQGNSFEGYTSTGTYLDHFTSSGGCDSARTLNLTVTNNITSTVNQTICQGTSFEGYSATGTYVDHFTSVGGCDSARTLNLAVTPSDTVTLTQIICAGANYAGHSTTGTFIDHYTSSTGCDSMVTLTLTVLPASTGAIAQSICSGDNYTFNGQALTIGGIYPDTLTSTHGCDSIVTLTLTVNNPLTSSQTLHECFGQSATVGLHTYTANGTYLDSLTSVSGCDSIITTNLIIGQLITNAQSLIVCPGQPVTVGTHSYTVAGTYTDTLTSDAGCDSIVTTNLSIHNGFGITMEDTICAGDSYLFRGQNLSVSGTYADTSTTSFGCDSITVLRLMVNPLPTPIIGRVNDTIATQGFAAFQWMLNGNPITGANGQRIIISQNGDYTVLVTDAKGCSDTSASISIIGLGINAGDDFAISLFPNPTSGSFVIAHNYPDNLNIQVVSSIGSHVKNFVLSNSVGYFDISELASGVYQVVITDNKQLVKVLKVVKE